MPGSNGPVTLPPQGASAEEMLRSVLPLVARSSAESAKAATLAAAAISSNEDAVNDMQDALRNQTAAITALGETIKASIGVLVIEKQENGRWMRRLMSPELFTQIVLNIMIIAAALLGVQGMIQQSTPLIESNEVDQHEQP